MATSCDQYGGGMTEELTELALFELLSLECRIGTDGAVCYYSGDGELHRVHGPAIEYSDGRRDWYQNGQLHRPDGPAVEYHNGYRAWYINGQRHRLDGPAVEYPNIYRGWYQNGRPHRLDGPAIERSDGYRAWFINGHSLTRAEWQQAVASIKITHA